MAEQQNPEGKKSSKKLIIIILAVVVLLGGAGAGYYFFMRGSEETAEAVDATQAEGDKKTAAKEKSSDKAEKKDDSDAEAVIKEPTYFNLTQPMIVNFPKGLGPSLIQVSLSFLADSEETAATLKKHEPMVRNNLMMKINAQSPELLKTKEGKEALRATMLEEVNQILSKVAEGSRVKEVFFNTFVMQ